MTGEGQPQRGLHVSGRFAELEVALCERVLELRRSRPLAPLTIVVGSAAVRTHVGDLLVRRLRAVANVNVVSFTRLAGDLVARERGAPPATLAGLARERFLRRLIRQYGDELGYFGTKRRERDGRETPAAYELPHFARALAATFADLREAGIGPQASWAEAVPPVGGFVDVRSRAKAADLDRLYRAYCHDLDARGLLDGAAVFAAAAQVAPAARGLGKTILYGIYDVNEVQQALVGALLAGGADVFEPLPREARRLNAAMLGAARAAGLAERDVAAPDVDTDLRRVAAVWRDQAAGSAAPSAGPPGAPTGAAAGESRDESPSPSPGEPLGAPPASPSGPSLTFVGDTTLIVASVTDERAETREALRAVVAAAEGGASLWDCAIVVPHGDDVERVAAALVAADLPVACRRPDRSPGPRLLLRLADCLVPLAGEPFARRAVVDLLAAAPLRHTEASPVEMALWLDEARQAGVVSGVEQWAERLGRRRRGLESRLADLNSHALEPEGDDDETDDKVEALRLRLGATRGLEAAAGALARARGGLPQRASWSAWADALAAVTDALFEPPACDSARDCAGGLRGLAVVDEEVDVAEAVAAVRELLASAALPTGRVGRDGVAVLTPLELRGLSFNTVVFTGLAEGGFPARGRPDPILGDAERQRVAKTLQVRLPLAEQRADETLLLFAFACEAARDRLVLLTPRTDAATGRPRLPSRLLLKLASLAAGRPVGLDEFVHGGPLKPVWLHRGGGVPRFADDTVWVDARERDTAALLCLSERGGGGAGVAAAARAAAAREYLSAVLADSGAAERRIGAWQAARSDVPGAWDGLLGGEARAALAERHPFFAAEMHPTRLERYIDCPFAFLLRDVLRLDAPDEPNDTLEMDAREFGTLAHTILFETYERVIAEGLPLAGALSAVDAAWQSCCADAERRGVTGAALSWEVRRDMLHEDLRESVRRDPVFTFDDWRPVNVEWRFGESHDRPVVLDLGDGRQVRFAGRVDRVDATPAGACVIDYKTGAGNAEKGRIKDGLSVQLPVYQLAVRQAGDGGVAAVASLYRSITRRGSFGDLPLLQDEETSAARLGDLVRAAAELVDAGMFPRTARGRCDYCDVSYACGVSSWARDLKRRHEMLAPVRALQGSVPKADQTDEGGDDAS
jgi:RecB family exonuclease